MMKKMFIGILMLCAVVTCAVGINNHYLDGIAIIAETSLENIDVYFLGGQSNAAGFSTNNVQYLASLDARNISGYNNVLYYGQSGSDPIKTLQTVKAGLGRGTEGAFIGPELGMANVLTKKTSKSVIIKYAIGASTLAPDTEKDVSKGFGTWTSPGYIAANSVSTAGTQIGALYHRFLSVATQGYDALRQAGYNPAVKGMVWMQGESDSTVLSYANEYDEYLKHFIHDIRASLGTVCGQDLTEMPFVVGKIAPTFPSAYPDIVRQKQVDAVKDLAFASYIETSDMLLPGTDSAHYTTADMFKLGMRFATEVTTRFEKQYYTVTIGEHTNGSIFCLPDGTVESGTEVAVVFSPNSGYQLKKTYINGKEVMVTGGSYTFNITENTVITAEFGLPTVTPPPQDAGGCGTSVGAGSSLILVVLLGLLVIKRKKAR